MSWAYGPEDWYLQDNLCRQALHERHAIAHHQRPFKSFSPCIMQASVKLQGMGLRSDIPVSLLHARPSTTEDALNLEQQHCSMYVLTASQWLLKVRLRSGTKGRCLTQAPIFVMSLIEKAREVAFRYRDFCRSTVRMKFSSFLTDRSSVFK